MDVPMHRNIDRKYFRGSITVAAFSRHVELDKCLKAIDVARGERKIQLIVVHQLGYPEVSKVIENWRTRINVLVSTDSQGTSPLSNINMNALLCREIAFKWLRSDWSLGVEEDTEIAPDALSFIEFAYEKYRKNLFFRGVNLGSKEVFQANMEFSYNLVSYGIQGQASMITSRTWRHFNGNKLRGNVNKSGLDSMMEHYVKSGFMCTPHNSRYLDNGWNGTHASTDPNDEYYVSLRKSFTHVTSNSESNYKRSKFQICWREDAHEFSTLKAWPRYFLCKYKHLRYLVVTIIKTKMSSSLH
jgi:hypothetical protein